MHELSIVLGVIDIATQEARKAKARTVDEIQLEIGSLAGVEISALDFAWDQAIKGTVLEEARKKINHIEAKSRCGQCDHVFRVDNYFEPCPLCNESYNELIQGRELRVKSLKVT